MLELLDEIVIQHADKDLHMFFNETGFCDDYVYWVLVWLVWVKLGSAENKLGFVCLALGD